MKARFLLLALGLTFPVSAAEPGKASLATTLPSAESNLALLGQDPLMREIVRTRPTAVVRLKSGQAIPLQLEDLGLPVHPDLMPKPQAPAAKNKPGLAAETSLRLRAKEQLDAVALRQAWSRSRKEKPFTPASKPQHADDLH